MGNLIKDLLEFSKQGRKPLNYQETDIYKIFEDSCSEIKKDYRSHDTYIDIKKMPVIQADKKLLRQVIVNLVSNAFKFSSKRDKIIIRIGYKKNEKNHIFYVKDNGAGFDMQYADKLFGVFQRLHPEEEFKGTGVGLSLAYKIINKHNGKIWAEAEIDKGATFFFSIPKDISGQNQPSEKSVIK